MNVLPVLFSSNLGSIDSYDRIRAQRRVQGRQDFGVWVEVKYSSLKLFLKGERRKPTAGSRVTALCWFSPTLKSIRATSQSDPFMGKLHLKCGDWGCSSVGTAGCAESPDSTSETNVVMTA